MKTRAERRNITEHRTTYIQVISQAPKGPQPFVGTDSNPITRSTDIGAGYLRTPYHSELSSTHIALHSQYTAHESYRMLPKNGVTHPHIMQRVFGGISQAEC